MMPKCIIFFTLAFCLPTADAVDFHKICDNAVNRRITIFTLHGDIKLSGYDGENIDISAVKKGPDSDRVEIEDASAGNQIYIFPKYLEPEKNNATVDFEIRVPKEIFYNAEPIAKSQNGQLFIIRSQKLPGDTLPPQSASTPPKTPPPQTMALQLHHAIYLRSNSGQIAISDVSGSIRVETGGRNIEVQNVEGMLYASSVSGDIKGLLKQTSRHSVLWFSSVSGNISVQAADDINAQISIQSETGQVKTDFPLETRQMRYSPGKFIHGKLGDGNQILNIRSVSGTINFSKKTSEKSAK